jgi:hypothetical protein
MEDRRIASGRDPILDYAPATGRAVPRGLHARMIICGRDFSPSTNQRQAARIARARSAASRPAPFASHVPDPEGSGLRPLPRH